MKFNTFLEGDIINLIILNEDIVKYSDWYSWFNDKKNTEFLQLGKFPNTKEKQLEYFKKNLKKKNFYSKVQSDKKIKLVIVLKKKNLLVGMVTLLDFDYFNRSCGISLVMDLRKKIKNRLGVFKESQDLMISHAFNALNMRRIYTTSISNNLCKFTERVFGFKCEGVLREHQFSNGRYVDTYVLGLLKSDLKK